MCDGPFGSALKSDHYASTGVRVVRLQNIGPDRFLNADSAYVDFDYFSTLGGHDAQAGDLLVAALGDGGHPVGRACVLPRDIGPAMVKADCFRVRLDRARLIEPFVAKFLSSHIGLAELGSRAKGSTRDRITLDILASARVPVPPLVEQREIVAILDRETARIDALIAKKRRLIELLREKRQAVISHAVTKGLDRNAPMKDSSVEWLGEIPAHWRAMRVKHCIQRIEQGWSPDCENRLAEAGEWAVLKVGCVNHGMFRPEEHKALPPDLNPRPELEVHVGELLMSRANTTDLVGQVAIVPNGTSRLTDFGQ
jgi:type I restriction enzyme S subunit